MMIDGNTYGILYTSTSFYVYIDGLYSNTGCDMRLVHQKSDSYLLRAVLPSKYIFQVE